MSYRPPQPAWGVPAPASAAGPAAGGVHLRQHPMGTTVLVLGFLSLMPVLFPLGIAAWVMGNKAAREIDADRWAWGNRGTVVVGRLLGAVGTILNGLVVTFVVVTATLLLVSGEADDQKSIVEHEGAQVGAVAVHPHADIAHPLGAPRAV